MSPSVQNFRKLTASALKPPSFMDWASGSPRLMGRGGDRIKRLRPAGAGTRRTPGGG